LLVSLPGRFEKSWRKLQAYALLGTCFTFLMFLLGGGFAWEKFVLQDRAWRWALLFLPLLCRNGAGAAGPTFPNSPYIECLEVQRAIRGVQAV